MTDEAGAGEDPLPTATPGSAAGDLSKAEFDALYKEVADNSTRLYSVISLAVTATTAFLGYFLKQVAEDETKTAGDPLPFIILTVLFLLIFPCMLLVESLAHSTVRIAGYIAVFYEAAEEIKWQTRMQAFRRLKEEEKARDRKAGNGRRFGVGLRSIFDGLAVAVLICAAWSSWHLWPLERDPAWFGLLSFAAFLVAVYLLLRRKLKRTWNNDMFARLQSDWTKISHSRPS